MQFQFLVIGRETILASRNYDPSNPKLVKVEQVTGFFEQVGRNTEYIIHPEEILADKSYIDNVLSRGAKRANEVADVVMKRVRAAVGL